MQAGYAWHWISWHYDKFAGAQCLCYLRV